MNIPDTAFAGLPLRDDVYMDVKTGEESLGSGPLPDSVGADSAPFRDLTTEQREQARQAIINEVTSRPPTIGVIGVSGTGKSSTINAMFKTNLAISHVRACTKEFRTESLGAHIRDGDAAGERASLRVVDAPGLGEELGLDPVYLKMYREHLPNCDVILWVITARNRAIALDQYYLMQLKEFHDRIIFGVNQMDLVEPNSWNNELNSPSPEQEANLKIVIDDRRQKLESAVGRPVKLIPYSAQRGYNLQEVFTALIEAAPKKRAWIFSLIKGFNYDDWIPAAYREQVRRALEQQQPKRVRHFPFLKRKAN